MSIKILIIYLPTGMIKIFTRIPSDIIKINLIKFKQMKTQILTIVFLAGAMMCSAQSVERDVVASSGDYYEGTNISLSWTLGEIATETYITGDNILTQGFQQPHITLRIYVDITAFLEGPYNGTDMNTDLNSLSDFPLSQPYNQPPWNYAGTESASSIPNTDVVDWILLEIRDAIDAPSAIPASTKASQAAFILKDGSIVGMDGSSSLQFNNSITQQLFVVVWHRNHLGMMSAFPVTKIGDVYTYNFSSALGMAYLNGQKGLNGGAYGMVAGDADGSGEIENLDKDSYWAIQAGETGYKSADFNLEGQVDNKDKNDYWFVNKSAVSQVPD